MGNGRNSMPPIEGAGPELGLMLSRVTSARELGADRCGERVAFATEPEEREVTRGPSDLAERPGRRRVAVRIAQYEDSVRTERCTE